MSSVREALASELSHLEQPVRDVLSAGRFNEPLLLSHAERIGRALSENRLSSAFRAPTHEEFPHVLSDRDACWQEGVAALRAGQVAMCVLAGGMATRMGGVVKALVPAAMGKTFLELRLLENERAHKMGYRVPLWLMTSFATHAPIVNALRENNAPEHVIPFQQFVSLRLTPEGSLFRVHGEPSPYATGHGDLFEALREAGLIDRFVERGGKLLLVMNMDNLGATLDPVLVGHFLRRKVPVLVEVCDRGVDDRGGIPLYVDQVLQIVEQFRLPDPAPVVPVFNTNTFLLDAPRLCEPLPPSRWYRVEKEVSGAKAIQFERLLQEVTEHLPTGLIWVARTGPQARFMPVKDTDELSRRTAELEELIRTRFLPEGLLIDNVPRNAAERP